MIVHIAFQGGTHGHFLRYFLDKFSALTPPITDDPTTNLGTYHKNIKYSGMFTRYHPALEKRDINSPHCVVTVDKDDLLHLQRTVYTRPGDTDLDLEKDYIIFKNYPGADDKSISKLYGIDINQETKVPKFIVRDFVKLGFSDPDNHGYMAENKKIVDIGYTNAFWLPVRSLWNHEKFLEEMQNISDKFYLQLELGAEARRVHKDFLNNISELKTIDRCKNIIKAIENKESIEIKGLDLVEEAYIYSWIETTYKNVLAPFTNSFFKTTSDILDYIKWYPHFYHGMNPTLPNDFYLNKGK